MSTLHKVDGLPSPEKGNTYSCRLENERNFLGERVEDIYVKDKEKKKKREGRRAENKTAEVEVRCLIE